jgi:hypothetical protein
MLGLRCSPEQAAPGGLPDPRDERGVMTDLVMLLAGPRFCPWCKVQRSDSLGDRVTDRLPVGAVKVLLRYDAVVGRIGVPLHGWLHGEG